MSKQRGRRNIFWTNPRATKADNLLFGQGGYKEFKDGTNNTSDNLAAMTLRAAQPHIPVKTGATKRSTKRKRHGGGEASCTSIAHSNWNVANSKKAGRKGRKPYYTLNRYNSKTASVDPETGLTRGGLGSLKGVDPVTAVYWKTKSGKNHAGPEQKKKMFQDKWFMRGRDDIKNHNSKGNTNSRYNEELTKYRKKRKKLGG